MSRKLGFAAARTGIPGAEATAPGGRLRASLVLSPPKGAIRARERGAPALGPRGLSLDLLSRPREGQILPLASNLLQASGP